MSYLNNVSIARPQMAVPATVSTPVGAASRAELVQDSYAKAVTVQTSDAPILAATPTSAGPCSTPPGGQLFCVPAATVGKRQNNAQVPDVFFDSAGGKTTLTVSFDLAKPAGVADAVPLLLVDNLGVTLRPSVGGAPVAFTSVQVAPVSDASKDVAFRVVASVQVDDNIVPGVLRTDTNAWFEVMGDLHYRLQAAAVPQRPAVSPIDRLPSRWQLMSEARFAMPGAAAAPAPVMVAKAEPATSYLIHRFNPIYINTVNQTPPAPPPSGVQTARVLLSDPSHAGLGAYFPIENPHNKPIYAKIMTLQGADDSTWTATSDGFIRSSAQPNQYYVLPDGFGLAIDAQTGMPAMSVLLVEVPPADPSGATSYRVRVRFAAVPWLAADRLERIRATLRQEQDIAYADLVIGGYDKAAFTPSHLFDKLPGLGPSVIGAEAEGTAIEIDAANGFELVLDCSMEFYNLLTTLVTSSDGVQGSVDITIQTDTNPAFIAQEPVRLALGAPAAIPLSVAIDDSGAAGNTHACAVFISNTAVVDVSADAILPTLLLKDEHMPYPSNAYDVSADPQALKLSAGQNARVVLLQAAQGTSGDVGVKVAGLTLDIDPQTGKVTTPTPELPPWSAVAINFTGVRLNFDPSQVLSKVHELASSARLNASARLASYLLEHPDQIPPALAGLVGIHVQVKTGTADPVDAFLTAEAPRQTVQIGFSFADLLAGLKPDEPTFQWRRCNMYAAAKDGDWSDWATNTGADLFVTPTGL